MIYLKSKMEIAYLDGNLQEEEPCELTITEGFPGKRSIQVTYDDKKRTYLGKEEGEGHFVLSSDNGNSHATLHMFKGGDRLEGRWKEGGQTGFWSIIAR